MSAKNWPKVRNISYRKLQEKLKAYKKLGYKTPRLNSDRQTLEFALNQIERTIYMAKRTAAINAKKAIAA